MGPDQPIEVPGEPTVTHAGVVPVLWDAASRRFSFVMISAGPERWIFPKGCIEPELANDRLASLEAWEEAGVSGSLLITPLGIYPHPKRKGGAVDTLMYLMLVDHLADSWMESGRRERRLIAELDVVDLVLPELQPIVTAALKRLRHLRQRAA